MPPDKRKRLIKLSVVWSFILVLAFTILPRDLLIFLASVVVVAGVIFLALSRWRPEASSAADQPSAPVAPAAPSPPRPAPAAPGVTPPANGDGASAKEPANETVAMLGLARATTVVIPARFTPPTLEELGAALPQFTFEALIGSGGMGAVYRVRQKELDRVAALKVLPRELAEKPGFQERFTREAQALAGLSHPHLVTVYDVGQGGGWCWLLMELVDGANLREVMRTGRLSPEQALALVPQLCDALQYAHDRGVVHRDIKPENILLDSDGRLKLTDFGLAKLLGEPEAGSTLTQTGVVLGTVHYMAPEQVEGARTVDHRADIYAVGVVLYEMLTGGLPLGRFQPPSQQITVDVRVDEVVLKALEKDPERRYQQAREVRRDVEQAATPAPTGPAVAAAARSDRGGSSTAVSAEDHGQRGERPDPDRRYLPAVVLAVFGLAVFGERLSAAFAPLVRYQIGTEEGVVDRHAQALNQGSVPLPEIWPLLGALAGIGMVLGAWSLLTLRGRALAVLGGVSALAVGPLLVADLGMSDRLMVLAVMAVLAGMWLLYATTRVRMADCFNHTALRAHGLPVPGALTLFGWSLGLILALVGGTALGAYAVVRPQVATSLTASTGSFRSVIADGLSLPADRHPYHADRARQAAGMVESVRGDITSLIAVSRQFPQLNRKPADDDQPSLAELMRTLETIQRGDDPGDGLRVSRRERVERACQQGSAVATTVALLFQVNQAAGGDPESEPLPVAVVSHVERLLLQLRLDLDRLQLFAEDLGTVPLTEFRRQVSLLENLTPKRLADPAEEVRLREDFARYWYSRHQVDFLLVRLHQYRAPTSVEDWLRQVLARRATDVPVTGQTAPPTPNAAVSPSAIPVIPAETVESGAGASIDDPLMEDRAAEAHRLVETITHHVTQAQAAVIRRKPDLGKELEDHLVITRGMTDHLISADQGVALAEGDNGTRARMIVTLVTMVRQQLAEVKGISSTALSAQESRDGQAALVDDIRRVTEHLEAAAEAAAKLSSYAPDLGTMRADVLATFNQEVAALPDRLRRFSPQERARFALIPAGWLSRQQARHLERTLREHQATEDEVRLFLEAISTRITDPDRQQDVEAAPRP